MNSVFSKKGAPEFISIILAFLLASSSLGVRTLAQDAGSPQASSPAQATAAEQSPAKWFRIERQAVGDSAELLTVFGSLEGLKPPAEARGGEALDATADVPLVSILRDTLGDGDRENDRLRNVWMLTYTRPTFGQRLASAIPFLYARVGNKKKASADGPPPSVMDLSAPERDVWRRFLWLGLQNLLINPYGVAAKSSVRTLRRNAGDYRKAHIIRALAILSLYEQEAGVESAFTPSEMYEIQGRLMLTQKTLGGFVDDGYLQRVQRNDETAWLDTRGHNWELLRQRAETEGLIFEPLTLPDGSATHALLWVARPDLQVKRQRRFDSRFLNISDPWTDKRLTKWDGFTETRYFDAENRPVASDAAGARPVEMIPLAVYGLDNPKIPALLVDFRDAGNPKRREMSRRVIEDITRNVLSLSRFGDIHYFLGRTVFDFLTGRRGMDVNQPTRLRAYSQLKLLLSLDASLDPHLRQEVGRRLERVSMNPLENDLVAEAQLARQQYAALLAYARRPDGLAARLDRDRRSELVAHEHGLAERALLRAAHVATLGLYEHREDAPLDEQRRRLDNERRLAYHRRFLKQVAKSSPLVEVVCNIEEVRRSLSYIAEHGTHADGETAAIAARIFARTNDEEARRLALNCLYRINNATAKRELLRIYQSPAVDQSYRSLSAALLRRAIQEEQRVTPADAKIISSISGQ